MLITLAAGSGVFLASYMLTFLVSNILTVKSEAAHSYRFFKDPFVYIFLILLISFAAIAFFASDLKDTITPFSPWWLPASFVFAGLIYLLFLLETEILLDIGVFVFAVLSVFLFADKNALADLAPMPWELSALAIGLTAGLITLGSKVLSGITGIFALMITTLSFGLFLISCVGGIPAYLGLMALSMCGIFICMFRFNGWQLQLQINDGAMMSITFLFCMLLLCGTNEFAGPSMLILPIYIITELFWSLFFQYILRKKEPDLYFNTAYFAAFEKGVDIAVIYTLILKICIINIVLAIFQLYAQNAFTLPLITLMIDFWLLTKINNIGQEEKSIKEVHQDFVENIKDEIKDIKQHFPKKG